MPSTRRLLSSLVLEITGFLLQCGCWPSFPFFEGVVVVDVDRVN